LLVDTAKLGMNLVYVGFPIKHENIKEYLAQFVGGQDTPYHQVSYSCNKLCIEKLKLYYLNLLRKNHGFSVLGLARHGSMAFIYHVLDV
jgi:hypothetical protein